MTEKEINHRIAAMLRYPIIENDQTDLAEVVVGVRDGKRVEFDFCNSWGDGGPLLERFGVSLRYDGHIWHAEPLVPRPRNAAEGSARCEARICYDSKPLVAAMRTILAMK
ncbi:hypothetical protein PEp14_00055 [Erwinia phage PEp14]|uniref:Uncharacterized protein n=1 Tax=Erwinia phage PEp14 TaxID=1131315 RepID=H2DE85_9CAUD|nr:hypothetical protein PEp14_00055 [Erwinia phage PEp14]AEY69644.1 hypothetical protein PEp14_00055 [Erwinia phage PEp14]